MEENTVQPLVPCCSSENEVPGKSKIDEIFKNMDILVDKEIKRNNAKILKTKTMKIQNQEKLLINDEETNKSCPYCDILDENEELRPKIVKNKLQRCDHENCFSTLLHMSTKKFRMKTQNQEGLLINHDEETNKYCPYCGIPDENEELRPVIVKNNTVKILKLGSEVFVLV